MNKPLKNIVEYFLSIRTQAYVNGAQIVQHLQYFQPLNVLHTIL